LRSSQKASGIGRRLTDLEFTLEQCKPKTQSKQRRHHAVAKSYDFGKPKQVAMAPNVTDYNPIVIQDSNSKPKTPILNFLDNPSF